MATFTSTAKVLSGIELHKNYPCFTMTEVGELFPIGIRNSILVKGNPNANINGFAEFVNYAYHHGYQFYLHSEGSYYFKLIK